MTDTATDIAIAPRADLSRIGEHFQRLIAGVDPAVGPLQATRAIVDRYGDLEPRPPAEGLVLTPASGSVAGEWVAPTGDPSGSRIVFVHGGGFNSGSAVGGRNIAFVLARETGAEVLSVDYRLAPEHPFPAGRDDVVLALAEAVRAGATADSEASTLVIVGESAGAALAVSATLAARDAGARVPDAVVLLSPYLELDDRPDRFAPTDFIVTRDATLAARADYLPAGVGADDPAAAPGLTPVDRLRGFPPTLVQVSAVESMLTDARGFTDRLAAADVRAVLSVYAGMPHVWHQFPGVVPEGLAALREAAAFIAAHAPAAR